LGSKAIKPLKQQKTGHGKKTQMNWSCYKKRRFEVRPEVVLKSKTSAWRCRQVEDDVREKVTVNSCKRPDSEPEQQLPTKKPLTTE
jgi:hypothetical protein